MSRHCRDRSEEAYPTLGTTTMNFVVMETLQ
jgi:hypothetical protein